MLGQRGAEEAEAMRKILLAQRESIDAEIARRAQMTFEDLQTFDKREEEQLRKERQHMGERLTRIDEETEREPRQIEALYRVALRRLSPVGLVVLWPETRG
jgi:hypothetical protein